MTIGTSRDVSKSISEALGLDLDELEWQHLALCKTMETELFYDQYETSNSVAKMVDQICLSCPVMKQCLQTGIDDKQYGVWGGIYLSSGTPDKNRNAHKSEDVNNQIRERLSE